MARTDGETLPTFHFGEGEHRAVAGGQRGDPGRVFLHGAELGWGELRTASTTSLRLIGRRHQTSRRDPRMFLEPVSCSSSPRIHLTPLCWGFFKPLLPPTPPPLPPLPLLPPPFLHLPSPPQVCSTARRVPDGLSSRTVWQLQQFADVTHLSTPTPFQPHLKRHRYSNHLLSPATLPSTSPSSRNQPS